MLIIVALFCIAMQDGEYVFQKVEGLQYRQIVGGKPCIGTLNEQGTFVPDLSTIPKNDEVLQLRSGPPPLLFPRSPNERVYEFRSYILVPMIIDEKRGLIPEVGGKIIDFKDYQYSPTARRIYNLPGRFVLKSQQGEKKP